MNKALFELFQAWLIDERKAGRVPGIMTSAFEDLLWRSFRDGWLKAGLSIKMGIDSASEKKVSEAD